jgi:hypothetical protein
MVSETDDRGQAFTLEGVIGSIIILSAVLFAIQAIIITPTTGGTVDPEIRTQVQTEANDVLAVVAQNETFGLSDHVRYWSRNERAFVGAVNEEIGYGNRLPPKTFGALLNDTFESRGRTYNVYLRYHNRSNGTTELPMVYRGEASDNAVTATRRVTLYDNMTLAGPNATSVELWELGTNESSERGYFPIPNAVDGPVYNIVEVRLVVW